MELLKNFTRINAPSGNEMRIALEIKNEIEQYVDELYTDSLGNLIAHKKGKGKKLMISANMDEVGFITLVTENNCVHVGKIGNVNLKTLHCEKVLFENGQYGIVTHNTPEGLDNSTSINDFSINLISGCKVETLDIGNTAVFTNEYYETDDLICSKALSGRAGCYAIIEVLKNIKTTDFDLYFVFTVQSKIGGRGAKTAAFAIQPDYAINVCLTQCDDKTEIKSGEGVALRLKDASALCNQEIKNFIITAAHTAGCNLQHEINEERLTESGMISTSGFGVKAGTISIPCKYMHSANEVVNKNDIYDCIKILTEICKGGIIK